MILRNLAVFFAGAVLLLSTDAGGSGTFVTASDGQFRENGVPLRFVGFNIRGICHYGHYDFLPYAHSGHQVENLDWAAGIGGRVIRVFCAYNGIGSVETGDRLQVVLDMAADRDLYVIVCLTNFYADVPTYPQGDGIYYVSSGGYTILGDAFFTGGYQNNYLPQATYLAERFRDHPAVFAWQVGNELRDDWNRTAFVNFCLAVSSAIRAVDPNHMISTGISGTRILGISYEEKVRLHQGFDFLTTHNYNGSDWENDISLAQALNKPLIIEEAGFMEGDRPAQTDADIGKWIGRGASGYMQWGFMASAYDNGDGDWFFGMDRALHADWDDYVDVYHNWAQALAPVEPTPTPTLIPSPTPTLTPEPPVLPFLWLR